MSKGKTFSITVPLPLFEQIEKEASEQGISRSKRVYNILQAHYNHPQLPGGVPESLCDREQESGICSHYEVPCPLKDEAKRECDKFLDRAEMDHIRELKGK